MIAGLYAEYWLCIMFPMQLKVNLKGTLIIVDNWRKDVFQRICSYNSRLLEEEKILDDFYSLPVHVNGKSVEILIMVLITVLIILCSDQIQVASPDIGRSSS